jgi:hypothetical protein
MTHRSKITGRIFIMVLPDSQSCPMTSSLPDGQSGGAFTLNQQLRSSHGSDIRL